MSLKAWTALLVLWGAGILFIALPMAISIFTVLSAAKRRLPKLLLVQLVLTVTLAAFLRTAYYSQYALSLLVPAAIALSQLLVRRLWIKRAQAEPPASR